MTIAYPLKQRDTQRFDDKGFCDDSLLGPLTPALEEIPIYGRKAIKYLWPDLLKYLN
jgi:hypothetical protein